ncbi:MAG TPA: SAM-dependent methyltransferase [Thermopolyspora sp.]
MAPFAPSPARRNRRFLTRAVQHLARIRQFVDIGAGLPMMSKRPPTPSPPRPGAPTSAGPVLVTHRRAPLTGHRRHRKRPVPHRRPRPL